MLLFNDDIEFSWIRFKASLFSVIDKHIPKIKIDNSDQPPWFDSETHAACRKKEWFRDRYNSKKSAEYYAKFSESSRSYKRLANKKLRDNVLDDDSNLITKNSGLMLNPNQIPVVFLKNIHLGET